MYLIAVMHSLKLPERFNRCADSWFNKTMLQDRIRDVIFYLGTKDLHPRWTRREGDLLYLPVPDSEGWKDHFNRTRYLCQWALTQPGWDYLFKCDDDTYVSIPRLTAYVPQHDYIGCNPWIPASELPKLVGFDTTGLSKHYTNQVQYEGEMDPGITSTVKGTEYASGGAGYILSRKAVQMIALSRPKSGPEDLLVGIELFQRKVWLYNEPRFVPVGSMELRPMVGNSFITSHRVGDEVFFAGDTV